MGVAEKLRRIGDNYVCIRVPPSRHVIAHRVGPPYPEVKANDEVDEGNGAQSSGGLAQEYHKGIVELPGPRALVFDAI